uniref:CCHC-type domain-containing protein n=1 Tax=Trichogramma kaykai TaxID=54128 RepID=A0ABD2WB57_9HYME
MSELISSTRIGPGRERQINFRDTFDARYIMPIAKNHIQTGQQLRNRNTYTAPLNESTTPAPPSANTQTVPPNVSANTLSRTTSSQLDIGRIVRNCNLKYSGEPGSSIEEFLERVYECRRLTQLTDNDLLNSMSELLTGSARLWARQTQHEWTSWQEFCSAARACFGVDRKFQQALIKEAQRRTQADLEPVRSYIFALLTIMSKFEDQWPLEMQLDLLHTNMRPDLQMQVRRSSITSVGQFLERTREAEGIELARRVYQKPPPKETCLMPELACPAEWREDKKAASFNSSTAHTSPVQVSAVESCKKSPNLQSILEKLSEELKILSAKVAKLDTEKTACINSSNGKHNNRPQERKPKSDKNKDKPAGPTPRFSCWKCSWPGYTKKTCPEYAGNESGGQ